MCFADRADLHCRDQLLQVDKLPYWFLQPSASPTNSIYQRPQFSGLGLFIYGNNEPERIISCCTCKSMDLLHLGGIDMSQRVSVKPLPNCFFARPKICLWCCAPGCNFLITDIRLILTGNQYWIIDIPTIVNNILPAVNIASSNMHKCIIYIYFEKQFTNVMHNLYVWHHANG